MTAELREIPYPDQVPAPGGPGQAPPRIPRGAFTRDPTPSGPPQAPLEHDPRVQASAVLVHPEDVRGLRHHPDRRRLNGCCRLDGCDGPNLVCATCGTEIATEQNDCWVSWHDVRLQPGAVTEHTLKADEP
ncbi:hypothetical protein GCM10022254_53880 [Actinomadura meridiana]|uniref:Uncharacterized protein n=1 Tax=Actinomadura meridiana TaxID=559626 RepID=A0ABP8CET0_9ACTN